MSHLFVNQEISQVVVVQESGEIIVQAPGLQGAVGPPGPPGSGQAELPQPLGTLDSPTFAGITLSSFILDGGTFN